MKLLIVALALSICFAVGFPADFQQVKTEKEKKLEPSLPERVAGCYELTLSAWSPNLHIGEDIDFITPPRAVRFFSTRGTDGWEANGYPIRPIPGVSSGVFRGAFWNPKNRDTIEATWTTGFSGLSMTLRIDGDGLRGQARSHWDFPRRTQKAEVVAKRIECPKT